jgi:hypothetical protein
MIADFSTNGRIGWYSGEPLTTEERVTRALESMGFLTVAVGQPKRIIEFGATKSYAEHDWARRSGAISREGNIYSHKSWVH